MPLTPSPSDARLGPTAPLPHSAETSQGQCEGPLVGTETEAGSNPQAKPCEETYLLYRHDRINPRHTLQALTNLRPLEPGFFLRTAESGRAPQASSSLGQNPVSRYSNSRSNAPAQDPSLHWQSSNFVHHGRGAGALGDAVRCAGQSDPSRHGGAVFRYTTTPSRAPTYYNHLDYLPDVHSGAHEREAFHGDSSTYYSAYYATPSSYPDPNDGRFEVSPKRRKTYKYLSDKQTAAPPIEAQPPIRLVESRKKVKKACVYCKRSHMPCSSTRPCERCVKRGIPHLCQDEPSSKARPFSVSKQPGSSRAEVANSPIEEAGSGPSAGRSTGSTDPILTETSTHGRAARGVAETESGQSSVGSSTAPSLARMPRVSGLTPLAHLHKSTTFSVNRSTVKCTPDNSFSVPKASSNHSPWWDGVDHEIHERPSHEQNEGLSQDELLKLEALLQCSSDDLAFASPPNFAIAYARAGSFNIAALADEELVSAVWHAWKNRERTESEQGLAAWLQETLNPRTIRAVGKTLGMLRLRRLRTILALDQGFRDRLSASARDAITHHRLHVFESVPQAVFVCSPTSRIIAANSCLGRLLLLPEHVFSSSRVFYFQLLPDSQIAMVLQVFASLASEAFKLEKNQASSGLHTSPNTMENQLYLQDDCRALQSFTHGWIVDRRRLLLQKPAWDHARGTYRSGAPQRLEDGTPSVVHINGHVLLHAHLDRDTGVPLFVVGYVTQTPSS